MDPFDMFNRFHGMAFQAFEERRIIHMRMLGETIINDNRNINSAKIYRNNSNNNSYSAMNTSKSAKYSPSNYLESKGGVGVVNTLSREGITSQLTNSSSNNKKSKNKLYNNTNSLGNGWYEVSNDNIGNFKLIGLHNYIESLTTSKPYICIYEPKQFIKNFTSINRINVSVKLIRCPNISYNIIFGYQDINNYFVLTFNLSTNIYLINKVNKLNPLGKLLHEYADTSNIIKINNFYDLMIEFIENKIIVSVYNEMIFDFILDEDVSRLSTGLLAKKECKFIFKNWKIELNSCTNESNIPDSVTSNVITTTNNRSKDNITTGDQKSRNVKTIDKSIDINIIKSNLNEKLKNQFENKIIDIIVSDIVTNNISTDTTKNRSNKIDSKVNESFNKIGALNGPKQTLYEAIVMPMLIPEFFVGIRQPWKGILLYGPPGTGKTLLAKAVSSMNNLTFFSCSSSSLISKWRGDSEKIIDCLFQSARCMSPSIIFIDEIDALVSIRQSDEHEASRRMKTEFFTQMDGITNQNDSGRVIVLAATNCPWDLDSAILRRLEKRIYVPLPNSQARCDIFSIYLKDLTIDANIDINNLAELTENYSGADIFVLCREAAYAPMRRLLSNHSTNEIVDMRDNGTLITPIITEVDFHDAIKAIKPSVSKDSIVLYESWSKEFGSI